MWSIDPIERIWFSGSLKEFRSSTPAEILEGLTLASSGERCKFLPILAILSFVRQTEGQKRSRYFVAGRYSLP